MKKMKLNDAVKFFFEYIKDVNEEQYKSLRKFYKNLDKKEKIKFIKEIMNDGISLHQPPFWNNVNFEKLEYLYDKYGYKPYTVTIEGHSVEKPLIISSKYMLRLKHEPAGKMSTRSTSFINMKNSPSKSLAYKKGEEPYSKTPIRLGEMELVGLLLSKDSKIQSKFNSFYSNNEINRQFMSSVLLSEKDILNLESIESPNKDNSSNILLNVLFKSLSLRLTPIKEKVKKKSNKKTKK